MHVPPGLRRVSLVGAAVITTAVVVATAATPPARAAVACRSDPVIVVNGVVADVFSTLWTGPSAVRELDYTVTVPRGSLIGQTTLTAGIGFPEKVTYVFSSAQPWGSVKVAATVVTQSGVAPFPTSLQVTGLLVSGTASGWSNAVLSTSISHLIML